MEEYLCLSDQALLRLFIAQGQEKNHISQIILWRMADDPRGRQKLLFNNGQERHIRVKNLIAEIQLQGSSQGTKDCSYGELQQIVRCAHPGICSCGEDPVCQCGVEEAREYLRVHPG